MAEERPELVWPVEEPARVRGMVHLFAAAWDPERGWLVARTGLTHRDTFMSKPEEELARALSREAGSLARAMKRRWDEP